jgi:hypothetical protein
MGKRIIVVGILLCVFLSQVAFGQMKIKNTAMKRAIVFRSTQDAIRGKVAEIRDSSIVVLTSEREVTVPFSEISRIIWTHEQGPGRGPLMGAVLLGYAGACLYATSRDHGGFVENGDLWGYLLPVLPSIALGAGIGYLVDPGFAQEELVFDFTGSEEEKAREKSHLIRAATHVSHESTVHITFQGSHVSSSMPNLILPNSNTSYDFRQVSGFNLLRKAQVTYSFLPELEAGIAFVWFSEPPQSGSGYENLVNNDFRSYSGLQSFEATGRYLVALYNPLYHILDSRLTLKVGGGVGIASIDFARATTVWTSSQIGPGSQQSSSYTVSDNFLVGCLFGQLEFEFVDGFSLGLAVDRIFGPSSDAPAVPEANIPAQTLSFENTSVGFTISLHF